VCATSKGSRCRPRAAPGTENITLSRRPTEPGPETGEGGKGGRRGDEDTANQERQRALRWSHDSGEQVSQRLEDHASFRGQRWQGPDAGRGEDGRGWTSCCSDPDYYSRSQLLRASAQWSATYPSSFKNSTLGACPVAHFLPYGGILLSQRGRGQKANRSPEELFLAYPPLEPLLHSSLPRSTVLLHTCVGVHSNRLFSSTFTTRTPPVLHTIASVLLLLLCI
jgi:hypothetical protein